MSVPRLPDKNLTSLIEQHAANATQGYGDKRCSAALLEKKAMSRHTNTLRCKLSLSAHLGNLIWTRTTAYKQDMPGNTICINNNVLPA